MKDPYLSAVRAKLDSRKDEVLNSNENNFLNLLKYFLTYLDTEPVLNAIEKELEAILSDEEKVGITNDMNAIAKCVQNLPDDEKKRAAYIYLITRELCETTNNNKRFEILYYVANQGTGKINDTIDTYKDQFFRLFYTYLDEQIDDGDLLLYILERYKGLTQAFDREQVFKMTVNNSRHIEDVLDKHLRRFLMLSGIDYPFSKPRTEIGEADVVVKFDREKPLPLEVKLYDGSNYPKSRIRQGFRQALLYAESYNSPIGHLVIFNLSNSYIQIGDESTASNIPKIAIKNRTIFFTIINVKPADKTASKVTDLDIVKINIEYLSESLSNREQEQEEVKDSV